MTLVIEPASDPAAGCPCCDPLASAPQGYVRRDAEPSAVYFGDWQRVPVPSATVVVSMGRWDVHSGPADRRTAAFRLLRGEDGPRAEILDATALRWSVVDYAGKMLDEAAAQCDPEIEDFRKIALAIAAQDRRVADALAGPGSCSLRLSRRPGTVQPFHVEAAEWR